MSSDSERNTLEMSVLSSATKFDYLRFSISDLHGISRGKSIPRRNLQRILEEGGVGIFVGKVQSIAAHCRTKYLGIKPTVNQS